MAIPLPKMSTPFPSTTQYEGKSSILTTSPGIVIINVTVEASNLVGEFFSGKYQK
jgi:hypothetical protein